MAISLPAIALSRGYPAPMDVLALQEKIRHIDGVEAARIVAGNGQI